MLRRQDQFRSLPPPPPIDSAEYVTAYDEVKEVGRFESGSRTPERTHPARWRKDLAGNSHNLSGAQACFRREDRSADGRAHVRIAQHEHQRRYISVFENKFFYNHWRPYTAIRWAGNDGNPATVPEPQWDNTHRHTYAFRPIHRRTAPSAPRP